VVDVGVVEEVEVVDVGVVEELDVVEEVEVVEELDGARIGDQFWYSVLWASSTNVQRESNPLVSSTRPLSMKWIVAPPVVISIRGAFEVFGSGSLQLEVA